MNANTTRDTIEQMAPAYPNALPNDPQSVSTVPESSAPAQKDSALYYVVLEKNRTGLQSTVTPEENAAYLRYREIKRVHATTRVEKTREYAKARSRQLTEAKRADPTLRKALQAAQTAATIERRVARGQITREYADSLHSLNQARRERATK